jgi:hypothetical protein
MSTACIRWLVPRRSWSFTARYAAAPAPSATTPASRTSQLVPRTARAARPAGPSWWGSKQALRDCDLFLAIGTSGTVSPASNFVRAAQYAGARTVFVNLEPMTPHNRAFGEVVLGRAEEVLPILLSPRLET